MEHAKPHRPKRSKREKSPAYQWYPKDALSDRTMLSMTNEEEGIYRRLLDHAWLEDGLPADLAAIVPLCRLAGDRAKFDQIWITLGPLFVQGPDGKRRNRRQERERRKQRKNSRLKRLAARTRWGTATKKADASALQTQCLALAIPVADHDQDQEDHRPAPARMTLSIWNVRRHLYRAVALAIEAGVDDLGALADEVKRVAAALGATFTHTREIAAIVDGAVAQWTRQQHTDQARASLARRDAAAMGRRMR